MVNQKGFTILQALVSMLIAGFAMSIAGQVASGLASTMAKSSAQASKLGLDAEIKMVLADPRLCRQAFSELANYNPELGPREVSAIRFGDHSTVVSVNQRIDSGLSVKVISLTPENIQSTDFADPTEPSRTLRRSYASLEISFKPISGLVPKPLRHRMSVTTNLQDNTVTSCGYGDAQVGGDPPAVRVTNQPSCQALGGTVEGNACENYIGQVAVASLQWWRSSQFNGQTVAAANLSLYQAQDEGAVHQVDIQNGLAQDRATRPSNLQGRILVASQANPFSLSHWQPLFSGLPAPTHGGIAYTGLGCNTAAGWRVTSCSGYSNGSDGDYVLDPIRNICVSNDINQTLEGQLNVTCVKNAAPAAQ
jgi:hypothetical protein